MKNKRALAVAAIGLLLVIFISCALTIGIGPAVDGFLFVIAAASAGWLIVPSSRSSRRR